MGLTRRALGFFLGQQLGQQPPPFVVLRFGQLLSKEHEISLVNKYLHCLLREDFGHATGGSVRLPPSRGTTDH